MTHWHRETICFLSDLYADLHAWPVTVLLLSAVSRIMHSGPLITHFRTSLAMNSENETMSAPSASTFLPFWAGSPAFLHIKMTYLLHKP